MIALGCDHGGYALMQEVKEHLKEQGIKFKDFGTDSPVPTDYPIYAKKVAKAVASGRCEKGILICGTGIGMSMAANRHREIRAALCDNCYSAKATREHNDANVLCMGARVLGEGLAIQIVDTFLETEFSNGANHVRRISKLS